MMAVLIFLLALVPILALGTVLMNLLFGAAPRRGYGLSDLWRRGETCEQCGAFVAPPQRLLVMTLYERRILAGTPLVVPRRAYVCQRCFDRGAEPMEEGDGG